MADTQLDSLDAPDGDQWVVVGDDLDKPQSSSLSLSPSGCGPPAKRPRLVIEKDCSRDRIRWIPSLRPEDHDLIPFVRCAETNIVHAGTSKMTVEKVGQISIVHCLSGCPDAPLDIKCTDQCQCLCHLLKEFYLERDLASC